MYGSSYGKQVEFRCRLVKIQVFAGSRFQMNVLVTRRGQVSLLTLKSPCLDFMYASNLKYQQALKELKLKQKVLRKVLDQAVRQKQRITDNRTATIDHSKVKLDTNCPVVELEKSRV